MDQKTISTMEFDQVKRELGRYLVSAAGKRELATLTPSADHDQIQYWLDETTDGADILRLTGGIPIPKLKNIQPQLKRLRINANLNGTELAQITKVLQTSMSVKNFFAEFKEQQKVELRVINESVQQLITIPTITKRLIQSIDPDGRVTDEASTKLHGIRQLISKTEAEIHQRMERFAQGKNAKYLSDAIVTVRNDRYVVPVLARYRNKFGGVVHDQSASGQTLYIEPAAVVEYNNRLRQAQIEEKQAILEVLAELSALISPYRSEIAANAKILGHLDFINAKARFARDHKDSLPLLSPDNQVIIRQARHPLIDPQKVVANDIKIGDEYQSIVITGPNTGGKTITLKTFGLIQMMGQAGLFIPAQEGSTIAVFDNIYADIGDEQSLEQNLSTFSGHMENVKSILERITSRSLVLLDELGAGTDPKEGAALAMSILDYIASKGSTVVITTHYPELKVYGYDRPGTINASMEFDQETLKPTYHLLLGIPGRSNGIEIAQRLGINQTVITESKSLVSEDSQDLNQMIGELVEQRKAAREEKERLEKLLVANREKQADLTNKLDRFNEQRDSLLAKARNEANHEVSMAKKKADRIIHHLRQLEISQAGNVKENELIDAQGALNALHREDPRLKRNTVLRRAKEKHDLHVGDAVLVKSYGQQGELLSKRSKHKWEVQIGILRMEIDENDLEKISHKQLRKEERAKEKVSSGVRTTQTRQTSARLDLRGHRYEQAMSELSAFIDHALLNNLSSVTIIHGKGTGALRKGTQEYLRSNPRVKSFDYAAPNNGGDGATIVNL
ncbi:MULTISPECIES: endonuclease MutS2 [Limosilactobacillus]|uniref:endonuclease MutS2 n=1 Tax=Limosilactobacillus TaxID=2742598 RepID=UPI00242EE344|nr:MULTISPECIES: endonuclease MutS2 [Limosilactobacillus]MCI6852551.1 endonuclease MutS2 [Limosilactobacillus vaginalis]MDM8243533.1 endonuclease MutS2 [Limosilactobacillus vaginalis]MDM8260794.1 endonuclease MutS2 [Limosilactobacillus vaginalis]MDM8264318.1 endonuclease MutS2 [Limosilactobacillus vaginalis]MDM8303079.1 endonuclease MutS2 [Limosilactobacillus vaginalis]